jgi:hypothetical protein
MLSLTTNVAKSAQNCPKTISLRKFEIPPKIEILIFFQKNKFSMKNRHQTMCSQFGFSIQQFFISLFYCQKTAIVYEFQHIPFWKFFFSMFHRSCRHVPNSTRNKNMKSVNPYLFQKWYFWPPKLYYLFLVQGKKTF